MLEVLPALSLWLPRLAREGQGFFASRPVRPWARMILAALKARLRTIPQLLHVHPLIPRTVTTFGPVRSSKAPYILALRLRFSVRLDKDKNVVSGVRVTLCPAIIRPRG